MYRLFSILSNNRNAILFWGLELIALFLIIRYNNPQRLLAGDAILETGAYFHSGRTTINEYFTLGRDNDELMVENMRLHQSLDSIQKKVLAYESYFGLDSLANVRIDSLVSDESFDYIPCRVIKSTVRKNYNYLTLNKGRNDGVVEEMGVLSPSGVAGKVIRVQDNYSLALSALNVGFKLTLQAIRPNGQLVEGNVGVYEWEGGDPRYAYLTYIPETVTLEPGYEVVTSGYSTIFPAGFKVGKIYSKGKLPLDGFYNAVIELATNFNTLGNVYLLDAKHKQAMDSLEVNLPNE